MEQLKLNRRAAACVERFQTLVCHVLMEYIARWLLLARFGSTRLLHCGQHGRVFSNASPTSNDNLIYNVLCLLVFGLEYSKSIKRIYFQQIKSKTMLHELFLSLSGHDSPFFRSDVPLQAFARDNGDALSFNPSEKALVASLADLSATHLRLKRLISDIHSFHPSRICQAVSASIQSKPLAQYRQHVLQVEQRILRRDAANVGSYDVVPLSGLCAEFDSWQRPLKWLLKIVSLVAGSESSDTGSRDGMKIVPLTGPSLINKLIEESRTGYPDIQVIVAGLIVVAEEAWLKQLSTWVLYGNLQANSNTDFFISRQRVDENINENISSFKINRQLLPNFVSPSTASSILFIGRSLNQIQNRRTGAKGESVSTSRYNFIDIHLNCLTSLTLPLSKTSLTSAIASLRVSLSKNVLQELLPTAQIAETLTLLRDYFLLKRGEFAVSLIAEADRCLLSRDQRSKPLLAAGKNDGIGHIVLNDVEVSGVLTRTFALLASLETEETNLDGQLDLAKRLVILSTKNHSNGITPQLGSESLGSSGLQLSQIAFDDLLLSTPVNLSLSLSQPLDLFLTKYDVTLYARVNSYLLALRRGYAHINDLWKLSSMRRLHPSPPGPPFSNTGVGIQALSQQRERLNERNRLIRRVWARSNAASFLLSELIEYFQGVLIEGSWTQLNQWLRAEDKSSKSMTERDGRDLPSRGPNSDEDSIESDSVHASLSPGVIKDALITHDPETISLAHRKYLEYICYTLFLTDTETLQILKALLLSIDMLVHSVKALSQTQQSLDLHYDAGVIDELRDFANEEFNIVNNLDRTCSDLERQISGLLRRLEILDLERSVAKTSTSVVDDAAEDIATEQSVGLATLDFMREQNRGIDRLLMKLDFAGFNSVHFKLAS
jgi:hypothetical protein